MGLRDVRDYRVQVRPEDETLGTSSPFNIKVESLTLPNFTAAEVAELYSQHTAETGQPFSPEALALASDLTRGQPWLVNALARQAIETVVPDRTVPVGATHIERAKEILIERRDTHLDSLTELKIWRDSRPDPLPEGLEQLSSYLDRLSLGQGTLILFDLRSQAPPLPLRSSRQAVEHAGKLITVLRL